MNGTAFDPAGRSIRSIRLFPLPPVDATMPLTDALRVLLDQNVPAALVRLQGTVIGILSERSAVGACLGADASRLTARDACLLNPPVCGPDTELREAYRLLVRHDSRDLLVCEADGRPTGLVAESDILSALGMEHYAHLDQVGQVMSLRPRSVTETASTEDALRVMRRHDIGSVVVVTDQWPVGIVTFHDLSPRVARGERLHELPVTDVMVRDPITIAPHTSVWEASQIMHRARIRHLPVVHHDRLVGMLAEHDIVTSLEGRYVAFLREIIVEQERELIAQQVHIARRESEESLRRIIDASPDMVIVKDPQGCWQIANRAALELFGLDHDACHGRAEEAFADRVPQPRREALLRYAAASRHAWQSPDGLRHSDRVPAAEGADVHVEFIEKPMFGADGAPSMLVTLGRDITDRVRAEDAVHALNASLEERVAQRTRELRATLAELETFNYSISHDLSTPLRAIDGFSGIVMQDYADQLDPQALEYLRRVRDASRRMARMIDDLLDLSRHSRKPLERSPLDLSAMARSVADELVHGDPGRQAHIHVEPGIEAEGDPGLLRTVLQNLLGNAWKFTRPQACADIRFSMRRRQGERIFTVSDNGVGFDAAHAAHLFVPFQRYHAEEDFEGSGIGLSTVQRIISRHGGRIWAESAPGQGCSFHFTLG